MDDHYCLSEVALFQDLSRREMADLSAAAPRRTVAAGQVVFDPTRPAEVLYIVEEGRFHLFRVVPDGRTVTTAVPGPGFGVRADGLGRRVLELEDRLTAAVNAVPGLRRVPQTSAVPRVTFTAPEVAAVGLPAGTPGTTTRTRRHDEVDRAVTEGRTAGFSRLVLDRRGRVVGATVVGPRAGEVLAELALATRHGLRARDLAAVMHAYPTWADGPWNAAIAEVRERLAAPVPHGLLRIVAGARRRLLDRQN